MRGIGRTRAVGRTRGVETLVVRRSGGRSSTVCDGSSRAPRSSAMTPHWPGNLMNLFPPASETILFLLGIPRTLPNRQWVFSTLSFFSRSNSDLSASRIWIIDDGSFIYKYNPIPCSPPVPPSPSKPLSLLLLSISSKGLFFWASKA